MSVGSVGDVLLGKYAVERELGRGGMGFVVAARHVELGELVAIKMVLPQHATNEEIVRRFLREAKAAARIRSEHVVRVSDVGRLPSGEPYMVMEMLEGDDLERYLDAQGPLPVADAVDFVMQGLEALAEAHKSGIVHRDLKPANLFVTRRRNGTACVKVLDFGISKLTGGDATAGPAMTQTQGILGSPLFMSPEQLESAREVDHRTDIWALGVILYQLLVKRFPFDGDSLPQLVLRVMTAKPEPMVTSRPELPPALDAVVGRCLAKGREDRYPDVASLARDLAPFGGASSAESLATIEDTLAAPTTAGSSLPPDSGGNVRVASSPPGSSSRPGRVTPAPVQTLSPFGKTAEATPRASRAGWIAAAVAVAVAAVSVAFTVGSRRSEAPAIAAAPTASAAGTATLPPIPSVPAPTAVDSPAASASATAVVAKVGSAPRVAATVGKPSASAPTSAAPNCNPPYTFDAKGNKVFKAECI